VTKNKKKKVPDKFHLGIQTKYRTLLTPSGKEYNRNKEKQKVKKDIENN